MIADCFTQERRSSCARSARSSDRVGEGPPNVTARGHQADGRARRRARGEPGHYARQFNNVTVSRSARSARPAVRRGTAGGSGRLSASVAGAIRSAPTRPSSTTRTPSAGHERSLAREIWEQPGRTRDRVLPRLIGGRLSVARGCVSPRTSAPRERPSSAVDARSSRRVGVCSGGSAGIASGRDPASLRTIGGADRRSGCLSAARTWSDSLRLADTLVARSGHRHVAVASGVEYMRGAP